MHSPSQEKEMPKMKTNKKPLVKTANNEKRCGSHRLKDTMHHNVDVFAETYEVARNSDTRPSWDEYFLKIARDVSERSNCSRRKVGAVIVRDNHIISTGYNGTPMGITNCFDGGCPRCGGKSESGTHLDECLCVHAEQNAICQAARYGLSVEGGTMYITISPCLTCAKLLINVGIRRVIYGEAYTSGLKEVEEMLGEAGVSLESVYGRFDCGFNGNK